MEGKQNKNSEKPLIQETPPIWTLETWLAKHSLEKYTELFQTKGYDNFTKDTGGSVFHGYPERVFRKTLLLASAELRQPSSNTEERTRARSFSSKLKVSDFWVRAQPKQLDESNSNIRIFLVRHGESVANVQRDLYKTMADHAIPLSNKGIQDAHEAGEAINKYFQQLYGDNPPERFHCRMWISPYKRTRQTAQYLQERASKWVTSQRENVFLAEQQFGLFEGTDWSTGELDQLYPQEINYYRKAAEFGGRFWAKVPLGESRYDVCLRTYQMFGIIHREAKLGITNLIIVTHGMTMRAFLMMWLHHNPEWLEVEPNALNGSVRVIDCNSDKGYICKGPQQVRQDILLSETKKDNNTTGVNEKKEEKSQ